MRSRHEPRVVVRLDLVDELVLRGVVADVRHAALTEGAARHLPARAAPGAEAGLDEVGVELFDVHVDAPVLAVDHHAGVVGLGRRQVLLRDFAVEERPHERGVAVDVEEVERAVAQQPLVLMGKVHRHVQRPLRSLGRHHVRRHAPEADAHVPIRAAVHGQRRRHVHVGAVERLELFLPRGVLELQEKGPQRAGVIKRRRRRGGPHVGHGHSPPRARRRQPAPAGHHLRHAGAAARHAARHHVDHPRHARWRLRGHPVARGRAFSKLEPAVAVLVELPNQRAIGRHRLESARWQRKREPRRCAGWRTLRRRSLSGDAHKEQGQKCGQGEHSSRRVRHTSLPENLTARFSTKRVKFSRPHEVRAKRHCS